MHKKNIARRSRASARRSPVNSYYRSQPPPDSSPFTGKTPKKNIRRYLFGLLDAALVILLVAVVGYSLMINSNPIIITNNKSFHSDAIYQSAAAAQLRHLANRNKITFNEQSLASALQKQFPEITNVAVELPLFSQQATVRLTIDPVSFILSSQGQNYFINSGGRAIVHITDLRPGTTLPVVHDQSGYRTTTGSQVLSNDSVSFIVTLVAECRHANVPIASLTLPAVPQELDLRTQDQPYYTKFYLGGDVLTQTGQFLAARQHFKQTAQSPSQYLDVRVSGKIFYK